MQAGNVTMNGEYAYTFATSAPSERVFSHAGELYIVKRANLGVQTFAILMLMRMNSDLI